MQIIHVDQLPAPPHRCAVLPHRHKDPDGFIDTGVTLEGWNDRVYVSAEAVRTMGRMFGFPSVEEAAGLAERNAALEARVAELEAELVGLRKFKESLAGVVPHGFKVVKRGGRPPKAEQERKAA